MYLDAVKLFSITIKSQLTQKMVIIRIMHFTSDATKLLWFDCFHFFSYILFLPRAKPPSLVNIIKTKEQLLVFEMT